MTVLEIIEYPDKRLRQICKPVEVFNDEIITYVNDMIETMYSHKGTVGMAATQVGIPYRIVVIDVNAKTTKDKLLVMVNPELISSSKNKYVREGCLSVPEYLADVKRAKKVTAKAFDQYGNAYEITTTELEAVAIQHEIEHLDGILFIDKVDRLKTDLIRRSMHQYNKD
ncbi:MAG: peptide deformylase [Vampirovibrionia bacterium]